MEHVDVAYDINRVFSDTHKALVGIPAEGDADFLFHPMTLLEHSVPCVQI